MEGDLGLRRICSCSRWDRVHDTRIRNFCVNELLHFHLRFLARSKAVVEIQDVLANWRISTSAMSLGSPDQLSSENAHLLVFAASRVPRLLKASI